MAGNCLTALDVEISTQQDKIAEGEKKTEELKRTKREEDPTQVLNPEFLCLR